MFPAGFSQCSHNCLFSHSQILHNHLSLIAEDSFFDIVRGPRSEFGQPPRGAVGCNIGFAGLPRFNGCTTLNVRPTSIGLALFSAPATVRVFQFTQDIDALANHDERVLGVASEPVRGCCHERATEVLTTQHAHQPRASVVQISKALTQQPGFRDQSPDLCSNW